MFTIEKTFTGDIAHRIHNQNLDSEFTENNSKILKCRRLHGHTYELKVKLGSEDLKDDMVLDYNELGFIKTLIDDILDHRTLISDTDPIFDKVLMKTWNDYLNDASTPQVLERTKWSTYKWLFDVIQEKITEYNKRNGTSVKVVSVSYKETPKSEAICLG